jgi:excisionase family DNA binding protein
MEELFTTAELAKLLKLSPRSLEDDRLRGKGIPFVRIGASVRYRASDVRAFLDKNVRVSTSNSGVAA